MTMPQLIAITAPLATIMQAYVHTKEYDRAAAIGTVEEFRSACIAQGWTLFALISEIAISAVIF